MTRPIIEVGGKQEFDAARILMMDQALEPDPAASWSTTALMMALGKVVKSSPFHDNQPALQRSVHGTSALGFLAQRGIDPLSILRDGFGRQLRLTIDAVLGLMLNSAEPIDPAYLAWVERRSTVADPKSGTDLPISLAFQAKLKSWVKASSATELLDWICPTAAEWDDLDEDTGDALPDREFVWFTDRYTNTFLGDWADESLVCEYNMVVEGWKPESIPSELLLERQVSPDKVRAELARRFVSGQKEPDYEAISVLTFRALDAIESGNRELAAAIFASARTLNAKDPMLANNHAFCLLPDDPARALKLLAEARSLGGTNSVLEANIATAHFFLEEWTSVLRVCETAAERGLEAGGEAWLWSIAGLDVVTIKVDPAVQICELALHASAQLSDKVASETWLQRRAAIES